MGLSTCHGIARRAEGAIGLRSAPGEGTTFTLFLPLVAADEGDERGAAVARNSLGGNELIIVVDDDDSVRSTVVRALNEVGFRTLAFASGEEAAEIADDDLAAASLLLTDVQMGTIDGMALASKLASARRTSGCCS